MIRISCTNCKTVLSIDDAFAGGVCRCQHCGTIQTVPASARESAAVATAGPSMGGSKSLYQQGERGGTGLDDLAGIVVSSGLSSRRLTRPAQANGQGNRSLLMPVAVGGGIIIAILVVIIIYLATGKTAAPPGSSGNPADNGGTQTSTGGGTPAVVNSPNFCGTKLDGNTIVYLLDCGDGTKEFIGELKEATIKSVQSLGSDRKFEILFWNNGTDGAYPDGTTTYAAKDSVDAAKVAIDPIYGQGQSDINAALKKAVAQNPDEIVIATAKGWSLDNAWLDGVLAIRGSSPVKIITYSLANNDPESAPLKRLAEKTGGSYHEASLSELRSGAQ